MKTYRVGEAAGLSGLGVHTIRFYEERGLLPRAARSGSGYRVFGEDDLRRMRLIANARRLGIPLEDVRVLLEAIPSESCSGYAAKVLAAVERQRAEVDRQVAELQRMREGLDALACDAALAAGSTGQVADCPCCLLMDVASGEPFCAPAPQVPARQPLDRGELMEVLHCDIGSRPSAPTIDDLLPHVLGAELREGLLRVRFANEAAPAVQAFAAAECVCCGGLGWTVEEEPGGAMLVVEGTAEQLSMLASRPHTEPRT